MICCDMMDMQGYDTLWYAINRVDRSFTATMEKPQLIWIVGRVNYIMIGHIFFFTQRQRSSE